MTEKTYLLVGAIDFGTTYSGWGCSFLHEFASDPTVAQINKWNSGSENTDKTPSCALFDPDKNFVAFGYEAENKYAELAMEKDHEKHYFFRRFKMILNKKLGERFDLNMTLEDEFGKSLPAMYVFSMVIKYLVGNLIAEVNNRITSELKECDIHWVLTVPAIWTDAAKQFMRSAGTQAGIENDRLMIALEPEAASLYCRYLPVEKCADKTQVSIAQFKTGSRYMILDAGGGTIDITVHEVMDNGLVKDVQKASGGGWGGILVDKAYEEMLVGIFTSEVYESFKKTETEDWLALWRDFEYKKRCHKPGSQTRVVLKLPLSLKELFTKYTNTEVEEAIKDSRYTAPISVDRDKLKIQENCFSQLFGESIMKTVEHVKKVLSKVQVQAILMVGGFSESPMLQKAIKEEFKRDGVDVIIPLEASSTILRGAIIYGHSPKSITERALRHTYGIKSAVVFEEDKHPERLRLKTDKGIMCDNIFSKHVEKNQTVIVGEPQLKRSYTTAFKFQRRIGFPLYASSLKNPEYIDDGCEYIGELDIEIKDPNEDLTREILVALTFSGTEIKIEAHDKQTGTKYSTNLNFLG